MNRCAYPGWSDSTLLAIQAHISMANRTHQEFGKQANLIKANHKRMQMNTDVDQPETTLREICIHPRSSVEDVLSQSLPNNVLKFTCEPLRISTPNRQLGSYCVWNLALSMANRSPTC